MLEDSESESSELSSEDRIHELAESVSGIASDFEKSKTDATSATRMAYIKDAGEQAARLTAEGFVDKTTSNDENKIQAEGIYNSPDILDTRTLQENGVLIDDSLKKLGLGSIDNLLQRANNNGVSDDERVIADAVSKIYKASADGGFSVRDNVSSVYSGGTGVRGRGGEGGARSRNETSGLSDISDIRERQSEKSSRGVAGTESAVTKHPIEGASSLPPAPATWDDLRTPAQPDDTERSYYDPDDEAFWTAWENAGRAKEVASPAASGAAPAPAAAPAPQQNVPQQTQLRPASQQMNATDNSLQQSIDVGKRFGREAYKRVFNGAAGIQWAARVQSKISQGAVNANDLAQGVRVAPGIAQYVMNDAAIDVDGNEIGRSFMDVFSAIPEDAQNDFQLYLAARHSESRMTLDRRGYGNNKPVLASAQLDPDGNPVPMDASESAALAAQIESDLPEFIQAREELNKTWDNFCRSWLVEGGLITEDQYDTWRDMYPDYIPTMRREDRVGGSSVVRPNSVMLPNAVRGARGSTNTLADVRDSMNGLIAKYTGLFARDIYLSYLQKVGSVSNATDGSRIWRNSITYHGVEPV